MADENARLAGFLYEVGLLKRYKRAGWLVAGVRDPESIADHSHRAAVVASVLAVLEGADPARAALLALFHDTQETRITDLPYLARPYTATMPNEEVTAHQTRGLPDAVAAMVGSAVGEYEGGESAEARCARDADKLECLLQAVEYGEHGNHNTGPWVESSLAQLATASARRLASEAIRVGSAEWYVRAVRGDG
ncbi:HD domain-containing protein [Actinomadura parmotrematis]|uniref:HD domain-containing protein n=1 Tax=Actinomadura parmotrematis TaxID=2864039 RepID=A0ABS7FRI7_9ACTN|nr:HD domain-containing protein [Actinomadura parmotrematis]MBW8483020.1 HD domain-containing protein [Actinomadura parmotrematis]